MRVNIENAAACGNKGEVKWVLEEVVRNLKELRDRTRAGDMAAIDEFFGLFKFNDSFVADATHEAKQKGGA